MKHSIKSSYNIARFFSSVKVQAIIAAIQGRRRQLDPVVHLAQDRLVLEPAGGFVKQG
jgi:hypothetical protein